MNKRQKKKQLKKEQCLIKAITGLFKEYANLNTLAMEVNSDPAIIAELCRKAKY